MIMMILGLQYILWLVLTFLIFICLNTIIKHKCASISINLICLPHNNTKKLLTQLWGRQHISSFADLLVMSLHHVLACSVGGRLGFFFIGVVFFCFSTWHWINRQINYITGVTCTSLFP